MVLIDFVLRLILAFILGGAIGFERQKRQRLAGMRTNVLVSVGAFLFVTLSMLIEGEGSPTRMAAQVVSGIGFLGAGVIIRDGLNVRGLNTAATLWCSAAVGVLTSAGFIYEAIIGAVIVLVANIYLRILIKKIEVETTSTAAGFELVYSLRVVCTEKAEFHIRALMLHMVQDEDLMLTNITSEDIESNEQVEVIARLTSIGKNHGALEKIASRISLEAEIKSVGWELEQ